MGRPGEDSLASSLMTAQLVAGAMMGAVVAYVGVAEILAPEGGAAADEIRYAFYAIAAVQALAVGPLHRLFRSAACGGAPDPVARLFTVSILTSALCEAIALYGFVLVLIIGDAGEGYPFYGLSLVLFVVHFPRQERWIEWRREIERAKTGGRG